MALFAPLFAPREVLYALVMAITIFIIRQNRTQKPPRENKKTTHRARMSHMVQFQIRSLSRHSHFDLAMAFSKGILKSPGLTPSLQSVEPAPNRVGALFQK